MPMPAFVRPIDVLVGNHLKSFLDEFSRESLEYEECAKKGRQVMDIAFVQAIVIETALDDHSKGAVAQADNKSTIVPSTKARQNRTVGLGIFMVLV